MPSIPRSTDDDLYSPAPKRNKKPRGSKSRRCGKTGKIRYASERDSHEVIKKARRMKDTHHVPIRSYVCHECGGFHLTSQEYRSRD